MDDLVSITLLRHGLTNENEQKKYLGWKDSPVNEVGIKNLQTLANKIYPTPDVLYSSDLLRCQQTASILFPSTRFQTSTLFREYHFGTWDGYSYEQLKNDLMYRNWLDAHHEYSPPNGETFAEFESRVLAGWQEFITQFSNHERKNITLVTHGGPIRLLLSKFAPVEKSFWEWTTPYGEGYLLQASRDDFRRGKRCTLLQAVPLMEN